MSRKHYVEVAALLKDERDRIAAFDPDDLAGTAATRNIARELALVFKRDNPRFNAGKFFDAAGFPELTGTRQGLN